MECEQQDAERPVGDFKSFLGAPIKCALGTWFLRRVDEVWVRARLGDTSPLFPIDSAELMIQWPNRRTERDITGIPGSRVVWFMAVSCTPPELNFFHRLVILESLFFDALVPTVAERDLNRETHNCPFAFSVPADAFVCFVKVAT